MVTSVQLPLTPAGARSTGLELRDQGIASLERHPWLSMARKVAERLCAAGVSGTITSDDLHIVMGPPPHPNAWGALFKDKRFTATGERVRSTRPSAHGRWVMVWRLA